MDLVTAFPPFGVVIRTPRIEVRMPTDDELLEAVDLVHAGIHDDDSMPFAVPWTRQTGPTLTKGFLQHHWRTRADWDPEKWTLPGAIFLDGALIGFQDVGAEKFGVLRQVHTGSYLGQTYQGQGIGKEMRAAILHFAFDGLGAERAWTDAFEDNPASLAVTRALGYEPVGWHVWEREGQPAKAFEFVLQREQWESTRRDDIEIEGLDSCLDWFGLGSPEVE